MNNLEIATSVLESANSELHVDEIAQRAISSGLIQGILPEDLSKKLSSALSQSVGRPSTPFALADSSVAYTA